MKRSLLLLLIILLYNSFLYNGEVVQVKPVISKKTLSLIFAGDIMCHSPQYHAAYNSITDTYNFNICFSQVKLYIENANFAIANLEVPIAGKPYSGYPNFSCPDELLDAIKNAGFDILLTANNHVLDRGKFGLERTISQIEQRKLLHLGSYLNKHQRDSIYPLIVESNGVKLALLNCTYGTNKMLPVRPNRVNFIDTLEILKDLETASKKGADLKIMTIHWGTENELVANKSQRNLAQFLVKHGVNLIIGSHPHVVQDAEILYGKDSIPVPVFYSLGNFISNQREENTNGGVMVKVQVDIETKQISSTSYMPVYVHKGVLNNIYQYHLVPTADFVKNPKNYHFNKIDSTLLTVFEKNARNKLSKLKLIE